MFERSRELSRNLEQLLDSPPAGRIARRIHFINMNTDTQSSSHDQNFGIELILNLADCDMDIITSGEKLAEYAQTLCKVIDMKPYGDPFVERFGLNHPKTAGYTLVQLIETSSIVGHFSEEWRTAYLNIFSCKDFDISVARDFTKDFFKATVAKELIITR